jgi:alkanesulfonate monooxygenase SsuD/methylene tetrahydromethanopterin reductase-like flavin-dependent oxidoreductase (luciferase family)
MEEPWAHIRDCSGFRVSPIYAEGLEWPKLAASWALAGETGLFDAGWISDHLTDAGRARGGPAMESMTVLSALASRVPGMWVGVAVASNTFRHPAVLAKSAAVLDNVTGGRFVMGLGAGWHEGEHEQFGITLPPMAERFARFESAVEVLASLFSDAARQPPGVTRPDPYYPLSGATLEPPPMRPGGPPIWLGVGKPRGIALAARFADGWPMPGTRLGDVAYFSQMRTEISRALEAAGRDPGNFTFAAQLTCGSSDAELNEARGVAEAFVRAGANHLMLSVPAPLGPNGMARMAAGVAAPLRDAAG